VSAPSPPADIASRTPLLVPVPASTDLYRFYSVIHEPIFFDRSDLGRLNAPEGPTGFFTRRQRQGVPSPKPSCELRASLFWKEARSSGRVAYDSEFGGN
jgi:hypothetical protein